MPHSRCSRLVIGLALLLGVVLGTAPTAGAAVSPFQHPLALLSAPGTPGTPTAPVSSSEVAAALRQQTGLSPSQVGSENACPPASAGHVTCEAQVLVLSGTHQRVHPAAPRVSSPQPTSTRTVAPATEPVGTPVPQAHTPAYLQQAYDLTWLSAQNGASDTVAIVDAGDDATAESDLGQFRTRFGLGPCTTANGCFEKVNESGQSSPMPPSAGWETEITLDIDAVSSLCPKCHILLVEADSDLWSDMNTAVLTAHSLGAQQISMSFGGNSSSGPGGTWTFPGVSSLAAAGDHGYPGAGLSSYPAAYAGVTAVGGTTLTAAATATRGYAESAWSLDSTGWGGGSGCDTTQAQPAYQPLAGCAGRAYSDVSADGDGNTGLLIYDTADGGWELVGGTSLATPLVAAYEAVTAVTDPTPQWPYTDSARLNDVTSGNTGSCNASISYICNAGVGYDGPTGEGSISGDVTTGGPGVGGSSTSTPVKAGSATANGGVYPNGIDTTYYWEYGSSTSYGQRTPAADAGAGSALTSISTLLTNLQPSTTYHYRLVAANADGTTYGYDSTVTTPAGNPPHQTAAPTLSGDAQPGKTLTVDPGSWSPSGTIAYQWQFEAAGASIYTNIAGATAATFSPDSSQIGGQLQALITVTNSDGVSTATAAAGTVQPATAPVNTTPPSLSGPAHEGTTLMADAGSWFPRGDTVAYQWQEAGGASGPWSDIPGATTSQFALTAGDLGQYVRIEVTETNSFGPTTADSAAAGPVLIAPPLNIAAPSITGTPKQGQTLSALPGAWGGASPGAVPAYAWQRYAGTWQSITGATASTYTLRAADAGTSIRVLVSESNSTGPTSAPSAAVGPVVALAPPVDWTLPSISGQTQSGQTLSAGPGTWNPSGSLSYQWLRCAVGAVGIGDGCTAVGSDAGTYALSDADVGTYIRVSVTEADGDGTASATSAAAGPVSAAPVAPPGGGSFDSPRPAVLVAPALRGRATVGGRITLFGGRYAYDTSHDVQFYRCAQRCRAVGSPGSGTYTVIAADQGQYIRAQVRVSGAGGTVVAWSANALGPVTSSSAGTAGLPGGTSRRTVVRARGHSVVTVRSSSRGQRVALSLAPAARKNGPVTVRVYVLRRGAVVSCTARTLRGKVRLTIAVAQGERVQVAAVVRPRAG